MLLLGLMFNEKKHLLFWVFGCQSLRDQAQCHNIVMRFVYCLVWQILGMALFCTYIPVKHRVLHAYQWLNLVSGAATVINMMCSCWLEPQR